MFMESGSLGQGSDFARDQVKKANQYYKREDVIARVNEDADEVLTWLAANRHRTVAKGNEIFEPWWSDLPYTAEEDRIDLRRATLRKLVYGNGLRRLLNRMVSARLLESKMLEFIDDATEFQCMALHDELVGYYRSEHPETTISMTDLRDRFGLSKKTSPTKLRDGSIVPMSVLGLWRVDYDGKRCAIKLGPVAAIFHEKVFTPVRRQFEPQLSGKKIMSKINCLAIVAAAALLIGLATSPRPITHFQDFALHTSDVRPS
jgi:hypothetical protein